MSITRAVVVSSILTGCLAALGSLSGCGNSAAVNVASPSSLTRCGVSVTGSSSPAPAEGGSGTLTVNAARECAWTARSEAAWISLSSTAGQGPGTVTYSFLPNPNSASRRGSVAVEDQRVEIAQEPAPCRYDVSPSSVELGEAGAAAELTIAAPGGCAWTVQSSDAWLSPEPATGTGSAALRLVASPNPGPTRTGRLSIGGTTVAVRQTGPLAPPPPSCSYRMDPERKAASPAGETFSLTVTASPGCPWTAASEAPWVSVIDGGAGNGNGTVRLYAQPNSGAARTGTVRLAGATMTIDQGAPPSTPECTFSVAPVSRSVGPQAEDVAVDVRTQNGCGWSAASQVDWIAVRSGGTGTGNGSVSLGVASNAGRSARTGAVVIAGITFTVEQAGAATCTYTLKPTYYNAGRGPDDVDVDVRSTGECPWTAASSVSWVSVSDGSSGTGNGHVRLRVQANAGGPRTTTLTIAGQPFTLSQEGGCEATLKPTYYNAGAGHDDVKVQVKTSSNCSWTSSSPVSWATITQGASGSGGGEVRIRVDANSGPARSATLMIAGEGFTLTQEAPRR